MFFIFSQIRRPSNERVGWTVPRRPNFGDLKNLWMGCNVQGTFGLSMYKFIRVIRCFWSIIAVVHFEVVVSIVLLGNGKLARSKRHNFEVQFTSFLEELGEVLVKG